MPTRFEVSQGGLNLACHNHEIRTGSFCGQYESDILSWVLFNKEERDLHSGRTVLHEKQIVVRVTSKSARTVKHSAGLLRGTAYFPH
jgi:hypothetical protein